MKHFLRNLIIFGITISFGSTIFASNFDDYAKRISMNCLGENSVIQFSVEGEIITISDGDLPISGKVDGDIIKKNGQKQQYIVNLGFVEYFIDFEGSKAVANIFGIKMDLVCY